MALAPDPFDEEVERLLADPEFAAELEKRRARAPSAHWRAFS